MLNMKKMRVGSKHRRGTGKSPVQSTASPAMATGNAAVTA